MSVQQIPTLPVAPPAYAAEYHDQLNRILRLYFQTLNSNASLFNTAVTVVPVKLTDAPIINTNAALSNTFTVTLNGNRTLANPSNLQVGAIYNWVVTQGAGGNHTLVYGALFKWPGGVVPVLSVAAGAIDLIVGQYINSVLICNYLLNFS